MELEEHTLDDNFDSVCAVCGAALTEREIHAAREAGPPFLCCTHAAENLPAVEDALELDQPAEDPGGSSSLQ